MSFTLKTTTRSASSSTRSIFSLRAFVQRGAQISLVSYSAPRGQFQRGGKVIPGLGGQADTQGTGKLTISRRRRCFYAEVTSSASKLYIHKQLSVLLIFICAGPVLITINGKLIRCLFLAPIYAKRAYKTRTPSKIIYKEFEGNLTGPVLTTMDDILLKYLILM